MRSIIILASVAALALGVATAVAQVQPPAAATIRARQEQFREIGTAFKAVNDELRKSAPGKFAIASSARQITRNLRQVQSMFPVGSGPSSGVKTKASAAIWSQQSQFLRLNTAAIAEADKLVLAVRGTDTSAMAAQTQVLGRACKSCHTSFRIED